MLQGSRGEQVTISPDSATPARADMALNLTVADPDCDRAMRYDDGFFDAIGVHNALDLSTFYTDEFVTLVEPVQYPARPLKACFCIIAEAPIEEAVPITVHLYRSNFGTPAEAIGEAAALVSAVEPPSGHECSWLSVDLSGSMPTLTSGEAFLGFSYDVGRYYAELPGFGRVGILGLGIDGQSQQPSFSRIHRPTGDEWWTWHPSMQRILFLETEPPAAPQALSAVANSQYEMRLGWLDRSTNEHRFVVERSHRGGPFEEVASIPRNHTSASISGLEPAEPYRFRVRAVNSAGQSAAAESSSVRSLPKTSIDWIDVTPPGCVGVGIDRVTQDPLTGYVYAIGGWGCDSYLLRSGDGGESWVPLWNAGDAWIPDSVAVGASGDLFLSRYDGRVFRSSNHGGTWTETSVLGLSVAGERPTVRGLFAHPTEPLTLFATPTWKTNEDFSQIMGGPFRSENGGQNWTTGIIGLPSEPELVSLAFDRRRGDLVFGIDSDLLVQGRGVFRSEDGGHSWASVSEGLPEGFVGSAVAYDSEGGWLFASSLRDASYTASIYRSQDDGRTWSPSFASTEITVRNLTIDPANGWVYAAQDGVLRSRNHGASWERVGFNDIDWPALYYSANQSMAVESATGSVFVGTESGLWKLPLGRCDAGDSALCLGGGRFRVEAKWRTDAGEEGMAHAVSLTPDSGYFWFFDPEIIELLTKIVDGCTYNERFWSFTAALTNVEVFFTVTDTATGEVKTAINEWGQPFQTDLDIDAFDSCHTGRTFREAVPSNSGISRLSAGETGLILGTDRFRVTARWRTEDGTTGEGVPVQLTSNSGYFWFFSSSNPEVLVKIVDGCDFNGSFWVFATGLTNVEVELEVEDLEGGATKTYRNGLGSIFVPIQDIGAFHACG